MRIGAADLLEKYGSPLKVAEAFLKGEIHSYNQQFVTDLVDKITLDAAKWRLEHPDKVK